MQNHTILGDKDTAGNNQIGNNQDLIVMQPTVILPVHHLDIKSALKKIILSSFAVSVPILIEPAFNFVNTLALSELDENILAATSLIGTVQTIVINTPCFMLGTISGLVSNACGAQDYVKVGVILKNGFTFAIILSIPMVVLALSSNHILRLAGQPEELLNVVQKYFYASSWGIPALFLLHTERQVMLGTSNFMPVNILGFIDNGMPVLLGYLLVNGKLGFPMLGIAGMGYATAICSWIDLFCFSTFMASCSHLRKYAFNFTPFFNLDFKNFYELIKIAIPVGIQLGFEFLALAGINTIVGMLGTDALESYQISSLFVSLTILPAYCVNQATLLLISDAAGENNYAAIKILSNACIYLGTSLSILTFAILCAAPKPLTSLFIDVNNSENDDIVTMSKYLLIINGMGQIIDSIRIITGSVIQGAFQNTKIAMYSGVLGLGIIAIPTGYILGFQTRLGVLGVSLARNGGLLISAALLVSYFEKKYRQQPFQSEALEQQKLFEQGKQTTYLSLSKRKNDENREQSYSNNASSKPLVLSNKNREKTAKIKEDIKENNKAFSRSLCVML